MKLPTFFHRRKHQFITVVSGLPRSGTSMMMKILDAGGVPIVTDEIRVADEDNPVGYFELERVKKLKDGDTNWLKDAQGKAVKVISSLLEYMPKEFHYKVIFMRRKLPEILSSQRQMLIRRDEDLNKVDDDKLAEMYQEHLKRTRVWLANQKNIEVIFVDYNELLENPESIIGGVHSFLGMDLDKRAMYGVPNQNLYRQRS